MSQELNTTMELTREDWDELWPYIQAIMLGVEEPTVRTSVDKILTTLANFPQARSEFLRILITPFATQTSNLLAQLVVLAEDWAFARAIQRGTRLLEGGYAEWERLEEGNFWDWCYEGCDRYQREEVAKSLGQHLHFRDGSKLQASYVRGQKNAAVLLEKLFEEMLWDSQLYASAHGSDTDHHGRLLLNEALFKTRRRTGFLNILAVAHGDTQRSPSPTEGSPLNDAPSVGHVSSPNNSRSPVDGPSTGHSQEEEAKRKMSLDDESHLSSKRPRTAERRDHDGGNSRSLQQSKHQGDETQEVGRPGTPHPKKKLDRVPRHKRCHHVVDWLRDLSHKFRASLNLHMAFLKKLGKGKRSEPPEFELENRRKHSSQSRSPGFRGGAGLNLRKPRKTGSPAELSLMTKNLLDFALEPTTTSQLHMANELPHSKPDSIAPLQSRTNKYSPRSLLEMAAPSQSPTPQDSPHSPPESIARQNSCKTQDFLDGGDQKF